MKNLPGLGLSVCCFLIAAGPLHAQTAMERGFAEPPDSAKPRVWWHWLSGNVTKEGITADLEWMHRVNIGGFQMFDGDLATPRFVKRPLIWMTPEWKDAWHHAAAEADRLHLEMGMAASGGWSETAGPWVQPQQGMKKYVWSETTVQGPAAIHQQLAAPPSTVGRYQTMPSAPELAFPTPTDLAGTLPPMPIPTPPPTLPFYRDVKVVAYRQPAGEAVAAPVVTTNSAVPLDFAQLDGHDLSKTTLLKVPAGAADGWIQFAYAKPTTTYGITVGVGIAGGFLAPPLPVGALECSDDASTWRKLADLPGPPSSAGGGFTLRTYAYSPATARFFRLRLQVPAPNFIALALGVPPQQGVALSEAVLHSSPRVRQWEDKAAFGVLIEDGHSATPLDDSAQIAQNDILDVTAHMQRDGTLDWNAPAGDWVVLRFGYSLTGEKNHPATPAATGLEVDKFSKEDVAAYTRTYTSMISGVAGDEYGRSFRNYLMDSWEAGNSNWTERMQEDFQTRRGYSLVPFLPVLTGHVVGSPAASDAFLWDFRRTLAELLAENHYGTFTAAIEPAGLSLYGEAMGTDLPTTGDGLLNKGQVTVPMGEFWTPAPGERDLPTHAADVREAASAAHIYGKALAATESFTTTIGMPGWAQSPFYLKPLADQAFAAGINRIVIHTSDHQPFTDDAHKPGLTLGPFGQNYTRNITWAAQAVAWNTYLARASYLLQQGSYVADVAYLYGEGAPAVAPFWKAVTPALPTHYGFDYVNDDVLLHHAAVRGNRLELDGQMSYRLLVLPADMRLMTLPLLRKLNELVDDGMTLLAPRPQASPSLADRGSTAEFERLGARLWNASARSASGHAVGKGRVFEEAEVEPVLRRLALHEDLTHTDATHVGPELARPMPAGTSDDDLVWLHRHTTECEIYFLATQKKHAFDTSVSFRMTGRLPSAWNPMTGERISLSYTIADGVTTIPMHFDAEGSTFVVFGSPAAVQQATIATTTSQTVRDLNAGWSLTFPTVAPAEPQASLQSWTTSSNPAVKFFSGTATYSSTLELSAADVSSDLSLDLGDVREIAEVSINGSKVDRIFWAPPYRVPLGRLVHIGKNTITVNVTNLWPNRMIGDEQPGVTHRQTFTGIHAFNKDSALLPSGMLGPVTLLRSR